jgi:hypothetical protein
MNRQAEMDFLAHQDDEYMNELATDWYFPDLFFNKAVPSDAERVANPSRLKLADLLKCNIG